MILFGVRWVILFIGKCYMGTKSGLFYLLLASTMLSTPAFCAENADFNDGLNVELVDSQETEKSSAYKLEEVANSGENTITLYEKDEATGKLVKKFYKLNLIKTTFGEGDATKEYTLTKAPVKDVVISAQYDNANIYETMLTDPTEDTTKDFVEISGSVKGAALYNSVANGVAINSNFIGNYIDGTKTSYGSAVYNSGANAKIAGINGNFVGNHLNSTRNKAYGGAIYNKNGTIGNITGSIVGNYAKGDTSVYGGAIYNEGSTGSIGDINGDFIGNFGMTIGNYATASMYAYGGAIYNKIGKIGDISGDFIGNYSTALNNTTNTATLNAEAYGGVIYNLKGEIGNITGDFISNYVKSEYVGNNSKAHGGVIYNEGSAAKVGDIKGDFINNYAEAHRYTYGGAIHNNNGTVGSVEGNFLGNYAKAQTASYGGAIYNTGSSSKLGDIKGNFVGNYVESPVGSHGGAIYNKGSTSTTNEIGNIEGDFSENHAIATAESAFGGAIDNSSGKIGNITGNFTNNYVEAKELAYGGAIHNEGTAKVAGVIGDIEGDFTENYLKIAGNSQFAGGGAIYNHTAQIGNISGNFTDNYIALSEADESLSGKYIHGGAIDNSSGKIGNITGNFTNNHIKSDNVSAFGGAIYNTKQIGEIKGDFTGNYVYSLVKESKGGAVHNSGSNAVLSIADAKFTDNAVVVDQTAKTNNGAAIYNDEGTIDLNNVTFDAAGKIIIEEAEYEAANDIYNTGTINVSGTNEFGAKIEGKKGQINFKEGTSVVLANVGGQTANLQNGTLKINNEGGFDGSALNVSADTTVDMSGDGAKDYKLGVLTSDDGAKYYVDVEGVEDGSFDTIETASGANGKITINMDFSGEMYDDMYQDDTVKVVQILKAENDDIQLALNPQAIMSSANADMKSTDVIAKSYGLTTKDTTNDAIAFSGVQNTLKAWAELDEEVKSFEVVDSVTAKVDASALNGTDITFEGTDKAANTLDLAATNILDNITETQDVKINDLTVVKENTLNNEGNLTINNVIYEGNIANNGALVALGTSESKGDIIGKITIGNGTDAASFTNSGTIEGDTVVTMNAELLSNLDDVNDVENDGIFNVLGGQLNQAITGSGDVILTGDVLHGSGSFSKDSKLDVTNAATLDIGQNKVEVKEFNVDGTLKLGISELAANSSDYSGGQIVADKTTIGEEAKLSLTVAPNMLVKDEKTGELELIIGDVSGDFAEKLSNNRYVVENGSKAGAVVIKNEYSAEDVASWYGNENNQNTAEAWDSVGAPDTGVGGEIKNKLNELSQHDAKAYVEALNAVAPEVAPIVQQTQTQAMWQVYGAVATRFSGAANNDKKQGISSGYEGLKDTAAWVQTTYSTAEVDDSGSYNGFETDMQGVAFGIEKKLDSKVKAGVGYAYTNSDVDGFMRSTDVYTHTGFVYGEYKPNNWFINGIASYGWSGYDESKNVAGTSVKADYDVKTFGLQAMVGYDVCVDCITITPEAGARYLHISQNGYTDTAGQHVKGDTMNTLTGVAGLRLGTNKKVQDFVLKSAVSLHATYDIIDDESASTVQLANGAAYTVQGESLERFGIEAGARLGASFGNVDVSLDYMGRFKKDYTDHTGMLNLKYNF